MLSDTFLNAEELFKLPELQFPLEQLNSKSGIISEVDSIFELICSNYEKYLPNLYHLNKVRLCNFKDKIIESLSLYNKGLISQAYLSFSKAMESISDCLYHQPIRDKSAPMVLYRMRNEDYDLTEVKDMFHIPLHKRHIVKNERFSISGYPSLYCAENLNTCWAETNKPDINKTYVSKLLFKLDGENIDERILSLHLQPAKFWEDYFIHYKDNLNDGVFLNDIKRFLINLFLSCLCSIKVKYPDNQFKPEYIIPQFLLQWVNENKKYYCIRYCSTKNNNKPGTNFVFPVRDAREDNDHCIELKKCFKISKPIALKNLHVGLKDEYITNERVV